MLASRPAPIRLPREGSPITRILLSLFALLAVTLPRVAEGHAVPRSASPAADATVATSPTEVSIRFSERVERRASAIEVLDAGGQQVDRRDARVDAAEPWVFRVGVPDLSPGVYTVSWRVLSADDGHLTEGAYGFVVGAGALAGRPAPARVRAVTRPLLPLGRWLALSGILMVLGVTVFGPWLGSAAGAAPAQRVAARAGVGLLALGEVLRLAVLLRQTPASSFLATAPGRVGTVELALTLVLAVLALAGSHGGGGRALTIAVATALLVAGAFAGHGAAAGELASLAVTAHALHLLAVAAWVGGIAYFATLFWAARRDTELLPALAAALPRFSLAATAAVGGLALTGLYLGRLHLGRLGELVATPYGAALLAKLGVVGLMLLLAAHHRFVVQRRLARAPDPAVVARFRRTLRVEAGAGLVALLLGAILGTTAPPPPAAAEPARFLREFAGNGATVALEAWPLLPGHNRVQIRVADAAGQPLADARAALLQLTPAGGGVGPSALTLEAAGPGRFESGHLLLGLAGPWRGRLVVQRQDAFDLNHVFELVVSPGGAGPPARPGALDPLSGVVALAIVAITALLLLDAWRRLSRAPCHAPDHHTAAGPAAQEVPR
jgi:copper transport protein